ncbi:MAG: hypothetical protein FWH19_05005 [Treponema sp.]|nr:hypothetical protein [Treponema sp.]
MFRKFVLGLVLIFLAAGMSWAQQPWWFTLERGKQHFRNGFYGDALLAFEDARRERIDYYTRMEQDMILLLSIPEVRILGDSLEFVERYITERRETRAAAILAELRHRLPPNTLGFSALQVLEELDRLKPYPEADFWLGETFRVEGELGQAVRYYERALANIALLENPEFEIEILYKLTEAHRIRSEYQEMERRAREIIEGRGLSGVPRDSFWATPQMSQMRTAMLRFLETEGVDRFLTLYRHNNPLTERAHRFLGSFFYVSNRHAQASEHLMFAFLIQNTVIIDEIIRFEFDYTFSTLDDLMLQVQRRPEILAFIEETEYYRTIHHLATALFATGRTRPARELWAFLAGSADAGVWGDRARRSVNPVIERAVEMP